MDMTGGPPPPPHGFEDFPASNGNFPPEMIHLTTSSSDALLNSQPNLERMNFLSAKNSVELHKSTIKRKLSLLSAFQPEDYEKLLNYDGSGRSSFLPSSSGSKVVTSNLKRKSRSADKSVGWADLDGFSLQSKSATSDPLEIHRNKFGKSDSVQEMDVDMDSYITPPSAVDIRCGTAIYIEDTFQKNTMIKSEQGDGEQKLIRAKTSANMIDILERSMTSITLDTIENPQQDEIFSQPISKLEAEFPNQQPNIDISRSLFDVTQGLRRSQECMTLKSKSGQHIIVTAFDGLDNTTIDTPRVFYNEPDHNYYNTQQNVNQVCGTLFDDNMSELPGFSNMHTPPLRNYNPERQSAVMQDRMNHEENMGDAMDIVRNLSGLVIPGVPQIKSSEADGDEFIESDKSRKLYIPSSNELPVPDPSYIYQNYPPEYHPLVVKNCKKDCRTWLWKSATQRTARLSQQQKQQSEQWKSIWHFC